MSYENPGGTPGWDTPGGDPYGQQPPGQWGQSAYGYPGAASYPRASQAVASLVLSLLGFVCCPVFGLVGMIMGRNDMKAIDRGETDPAQRGLAQAGWIIGLVNVIITGAVLAFYVVFIVIAVAAEGA